jgi:hypothetical protein
LSQALYPNDALDSCLFWQLIHPIDQRTATPHLGEENYLGYWHFASVQIIAKLLCNVKRNSWGWPKMRIPTQIGHPFRCKPATFSDPNRPGIPF